MSYFYEVKPFINGLKKVKEEIDRMERYIRVTSDKLSYMDDEYVSYRPEELLAFTKWVTDYTKKFLKEMNNSYKSIQSIEALEDHPINTNYDNFDEIYLFIEFIENVIEILVKEYSEEEYNAIDWFNHCIAGHWTWHISDKAYLELEKLIKEQDDFKIIILKSQPEHDKFEPSGCIKCDIIQIIQRYIHHKHEMIVSESSIIIEMVLDPIMIEFQSLKLHSPSEVWKPLRDYYKQLAKEKKAEAKKNKELKTNQKLKN